MNRRVWFVLSAVLLFGIYFSGCLGFSSTSSETGRSGGWSLGMLSETSASRARANYIQSREPVSAAEADLIHSQADVNRAYAQDPQKFGYGYGPTLPSAVGYGYGQPLGLALYQGVIHNRQANTLRFTQEDMGYDVIILAGQMRPIALPEGKWYLRARVQNGGVWSQSYLHKVSVSTIRNARLYFGNMYDFVIEY